jgi:homopolymeric O-antigen transport system ATP-binding protein
MGDAIIQVTGLSKQYQRRAPSRASLRAIARRARRWLRYRRRATTTTPTSNAFWALDDVGFELERGDRLGIIGRNGAGKSTLLKILARIVYPTRGEVRIRGRVAALLEVGTGFNMKLTGRENIYLSASIQGLGRRAIEARFDNIVEFSGVGDFLDTPVKHYSSGMYLRLAFSVAAHLDPDVLLLDEVLAVGDMAFQEKCLGKVGELAGDEQKTILYVSHSLASVASLCTKVMWLDAGRIRYLGDPDTAISLYTRAVHATAGESLDRRGDRTGTGELRFTRIWLADESGAPVPAIRSGETLRVVVEYESHAPFERPRHVLVCMIVLNDRQQRLFGCPSDVLNVDLTDMPPRGSFVCVIPNLPLQRGTYSVHVSCLLNRRLVDKVSHAADFTVVDGDFFGTGHLAYPGFGDVLMQHHWYVIPSDGSGRATMTPGLRAADVPQV